MHTYVLGRATLYIYIIHTYMHAPRLMIKENYFKAAFVVGLMIGTLYMRIEYQQGSRTALVTVASVKEQRRQPPPPGGKSVLPLSMRA